MKRICTFRVTSLLPDALAWRYAMFAKIDDARLTISMVKDLDFMVAIWRNCRSAPSFLVLSLALVGERGPRENERGEQSSSMYLIARIKSDDLLYGLVA